MAEQLVHLAKYRDPDHTRWIGTERVPRERAGRRQHQLERQGIYVVPFAEIDPRLEGQTDE